MAIFKGESGRLLRVNSGFDMSLNSDIKLIFTDPDGVLTEKGSSDGVILRSSGVTDDDLGVLLANQYVEYEVEVGLFSVAGRWCLQLKYENTNAVPVDNLYGSISRFVVLERC